MLLWLRGQVIHEVDVTIFVVQMHSSEPRSGSTPVRTGESFIEPTHADKIGEIRNQLVMLRDKLASLDPSATEDRARTEAAIAEIIQDLENAKEPASAPPMPVSTPTPSSHKVRLMSRSHAISRILGCVTSCSTSDSWGWRPASFYPRHCFVRRIQRHCPTRGLNAPQRQQLHVSRLSGNMTIQQASQEY